MKNLFYKEIKLCMNASIYLFIFLFPLMIFIPNYPLFVSFIYICSAYPFIFIGSNKGQNNNDILYSCLLPIRKKDVVKGRLMLLTAVQIVPMLIMGALCPLAMLLKQSFPPAEGQTGIPGFGLDSIVSVFAFALVAYAIYDFIYVVFYYKRGKSILAPTLVGILTLALFLFLFTTFFPIFIPSYMAFFTVNIGFQFLYLLAGAVIAVGIKIIAYKIASKEFEKADF